MAVVKTPLGAQVMRDRSIALSAVQRSALILFDGQRSIQDVLRMTAGLGATQADIDVLLAEKLISQPSPVTPIASTPVAAQAPQPAPDRATSQATGADEARLKQALNLAIELTSNAGFKGFGLTMELTGVGSMERLRSLAPELQRVIGTEKFKPLGELLKP